MFDLTNEIYHEAKKPSEHLDAIHWPNGPICPHFGNIDPARITKLAGKSTRLGASTKRLARNTQLARSPGTQPANMSATKAGCRSTPTPLRTCSLSSNPACTAFTSIAAKPIFTVTLKSSISAITVAPSSRSRMPNTRRIFLPGAAISALPIGGLVKPVTLSRKLESASTNVPWGKRNKCEQSPCATHSGFGDCKGYRSHNPQPASQLKSNHRAARHENTSDFNPPRRVLRPSL